MTDSRLDLHRRRFLVNDADEVGLGHGCLGWIVSEFVYKCFPSARRRALTVADLRLQPGNSWSRTRHPLYRHNLPSRRTTSSFTSPSSSACY